jgi:hypothetical protein
MSNSNVLKGVGILGGLLIIVGCFLPIVSILELNVAFMDDGGDGVLMIPLAIIAMALIFFNRTRWAILPGLLILAILLLNFFDVQSTLNQDDFGEFMQMEMFGWLVLFVGTAMLIGVGVKGFLDRRAGKADALTPVAA